MWDNEDLSGLGTSLSVNGEMSQGTMFSVKAEQGS